MWSKYLLAHVQQSLPGRATPELSNYDPQRQKNKSVLLGPFTAAASQSSIRTRALCFLRGASVAAAPPRTSCPSRSAAAACALWLRAPPPPRQPWATRHRAPRARARAYFAKEGSGVGAFGGGSLEHPRPWLHAWWAVGWYFLWELPAAPSHPEQFVDQRSFWPSVSVAKLEGGVPYGALLSRRSTTRMARCIPAATAVQSTRCASPSTRSPCAWALRGPPRTPRAARRRAAARRHRRSL